MVNQHAANISSGLNKLAGIGAMLLAMLMSLLLLVAAYGGLVDPRYSVKLTLFNLALPYLAMLTMVLAVAMLLLKQWRSAAVLGVAMLLSWPSVGVVMPLNVLTDDVSEIAPAKRLKVMSFNARYFNYKEGTGDGDRNQSVDMLLECDADIVVIQEGSAGKKLKTKPGVTPEMISQLNEKYPYASICDEAMSVLSKFPVSGGKYRYLGEDSSHEVVYKIDVDGRELNLVNLHLQSMHLNNSDKEFITNNANTNLVTDSAVYKTLRRSIFTKLGKAFRSHATQADTVRAHVDRMSENVILCGDFNDVATSWSYRTLRGDDFSDAHEDCGFGPIVTFHEHKLWLGIDHILYRGKLRAVDFERIDAKVSDHYPIVATFEWLD